MEITKQSNLSLEGVTKYYIYIVYVYVCGHEENMKKYNLLHAFS